MKKIIFLLLCFWCSAINALATTYYVDNTASGNGDSNNGLSQTFTSGTNGPWNSIGKCVSKPLVAGDTCKVLHGVYDAHISVTISGSSGVGNAITFDGNSKSAITRTWAVTGSYITINGFNISNCADVNHTPGTACTTPMSSDTDFSVDISGNNSMTGLTVSNNHFYDTYQDCISNNNANSGTTFLHVAGNQIDYCHMYSEIIPFASGNWMETGFSFTINSSNNQVAFSVNGGATETITMPSGAWNGGNVAGGPQATFNAGTSDAEMICGDGANCSIHPKPPLTGPTNKIQLLFVANNAYDAFGWTGSGSQCGTNVSGSFPCNGVFDGHGNVFSGVGLNALIENNTVTHFGVFATEGSRSSGSAGLIKLVLRNNVMGPQNHFTWNHADGFEDGGFASGVMIEANSCNNCNDYDNRLPMGFWGDFGANESQLIGRFNYTYLGNGTSGYAPAGLVRFYNNDLGVNGTIYQNVNGTQMNTSSSPSNNKAANNIWYNACCGGANTDPYNSGGTHITVANDLYFMGLKPCTGNGGTSCSGNSGIIGPTDPLFNSVSTGDYRLTSSSPARSQGAWLTTASGSGSGTSITVADPYWFQDGWAGINPDTICVTTVTNCAAITAGSINFSTGAMTVQTSLAAWSSGDNVTLGKRSDGTPVLGTAASATAPFIGALDQVSGCVTPTQLVFTAQPSSANVGASLGTIAVTEEDGSGNICSSASDTITLANHSGSCIGMTLNGTTSGAASMGVLTVSGNNETGATGSCSIDATATGLTGATSNTITISAATNRGARGRLRASNETESFEAEALLPEAVQGR